MANRRRHSSSVFQPDQLTAAGGSSGRHPIYHGIRLRAGKWVSEIREPNKSTRIWLGTYQTPKMAAAAYDAAALALKGTYATLNFPESINLWDTLPECPTAEDIRAAAARAAASKSPNFLYESGDGNMLANGTNDTGGFVDDETVFDMPNLLSEMAQGMLISPPRVNYSLPEDGSSSYYSGGDNLWNY
ncbi:hypothetical protein QVD17_35690 [Tagetes erecta]|uniref:AP2/ERF domain-containing protein n=1 Tax=Tagetes erecta TaxID=13708 RepID=A0AAD8JX38_TARER|nr:hypothetical protein QVD17_35690 [Tagetes erecta]